MKQKFTERLSWLFSVTNAKASALAEFVGVDKGYISLLRSGRRECPATQVVDKIADFFGVNRVWLDTGIGGPEFSETTLERSDVPPDIAKAIAAGPAGAAEEMEDEELLETIAEHVNRFREDKPYMRSAHAAIAAALAAELEGRYPFLATGVLAGKRAVPPVADPANRKPSAGTIFRDKASVSLPIFGSLPAGSPDPIAPEHAAFVEHVIRKNWGVEPVPEHLRRMPKPLRTVQVRRGRFPEGAFGLKVRGDSMNAAKPEPILDGDVVVLLPPDAREVRSGDIVAALIDGETCLKRLVNGDRPAHLKSESTNPAHGELLPLCQLDIQGVVIGKLTRAEAGKVKA